MDEKKPLLELKNLKKYFDVSTGFFKKERAYLTAVDDVSFEIYKGETFGLVGESGCGKSTLAKIMTGLLQPESGTISYCGTDLGQLDKQAKAGFRRSVQMIFQDPFSSLNPRMRIGDIIAEPLQIHRLYEQSEIMPRTLELMEKTGLLAEHYHRFPHEFSGGQRQRIGIARALAAEPKVLVADEPVSSLDISIQAQIINLLQELKHNHGLTMLVVSHDLSVLRHICNRIAVMYLGSIVELAPAETLFMQCQHPYSQALLAAIPTISGGAAQKAINNLQAGEPPSAINLPKGCHFHPRCPYSQEVCCTTPPPLAELQPGHQVACHLAGKLGQS